MQIKVLQKGLMNDPEQNPVTYGENEFATKFGIGTYDDIADDYFDFHEEDRDSDGKVRFWRDGLFVEIWGK